ncbi:bone morphogenetic protein 2-like [Saccoglossus kowalevskii]|uniref:Bone morphogenetic protein 2-A-like n=1 Tax=Saccoglossus kowalevskii TaxID=10224 RepID=A0ABM0MAP9_SACKO|nr:PREDICTED: bone morphogenetic protein 2-A-like [Saccoglossus kowalevskii]
MIWRVYMVLICALVCNTLNIDASPENESLELEWTDNAPVEPTVSDNVIDNGTTANTTAGSSVSRYYDNVTPPVSDSATFLNGEARASVMRNRMKTTRLALIRKQILTSLGMKEPPKNIKPISGAQMKHIVQMFRKTISKSEEGERENEDPRFKRLEITKSSCNPPAGIDVLAWKNTSSSVLRLFFDLSFYPIDDSIISANLKLHKKMHQSPGRSLYDGNTRNNVTHSTYIDDDAVNVGLHDNESEVRVTVYKLRHKSNRLHRKLLETLPVSVNFEGWLEFTITTAVKRWVASPDKNFGLEIHVENIPNEENYNVSNIEFDSPNCDNTSSNKPLAQMYETFEPILEVMTISERSRHVRSSSDGCMSSATCCASPLYVSFEDLGWNYWILAPRGFNTAFCTGSCIPVYTSDKSNLPRSYFWHRASLTSPEKNYCCGPTKVKPLRVLYVSQDGTYGITSLNDFIVQKCGCRS